MDLNDLTATELARLDAICLDYEQALRNGNAPSIESVVEAKAGKHADILRNELIAVRDEISKADSTNPARSVAVVWGSCTRRSTLGLIARLPSRCCRLENRPKIRKNGLRCVNALNARHVRSLH